MIRRVLMALALALSGACAHGAAQAQPQAPAAQSHALLDKLVGQWTLTGTIAGQTVTHDVTAAWVLQGQYVRLDEVSRERDANGQPQYEAAVYVGWLESEQHFVCIWLDNTAVASPAVTCVAPQAPNALAFEFRDGQGALMIATTFAYRAADESWTWRIDNIENGAPRNFATLTMRRR